MIIEGQIVLFRFPQIDQTEAKLRPALVSANNKDLNIPLELSRYFLCRFRI